jgi:AhpD family alkylhydroperoxidase
MPHCHESVAPSGAEVGNVESAGALKGRGFSRTVDRFQWLKARLGSGALSKLNAASFSATPETPKASSTENHLCRTGDKMATLGLVEYKDASPEVRAIYDDIMAVRKTDWINNFWKALAHDPAALKRTWEDIKQIMGLGALDPLTKELIYVAVSVSNQCDYCIASHTVSARKKGMTDAMFKELMAVVGMANETNRLSAGYQVEIDEQFKGGR